MLCKTVIRTLIGWCIIIYARSARWFTFQIDEFEFDMKRNVSDRKEYMNIHPPPPSPLNVLVTAGMLWAVFRAKPSKMKIDIYIYKY